ncbi:MAG: M1 family metallopeptidase [Pyrinomonadaceae bacterium]|nr:M1 family metallopeptidase [Pyrinomonadaceae bacterium]
MRHHVVIALSLLLLIAPAAPAQSKAAPSDKFRQLEEILPTPNEYRAASGAPGHRYWQQRADYTIDVEIDDATQRLLGKETITYYNQSPDTLNYLWLQLDQNIFEKNSDANLTRTGPEQLTRFSLSQLENRLYNETFDGGHKITSVRDARNAPLKYTVVKTMMRIDLPQPLAPGQQTQFSVDWNYNINDARRISSRSGYEFFPKDGNYLYEMAQWFPRMAAYNDVSGWQHKQFLGAGEFTLEFGNYRVRITVPNDHVVGSTGVLQNPNEMLTPEQRQRLKQAETAKEPLKIITQAEAEAAERGKPTGKKTWVFHADNVRDFAFASSRKFIWDAQLHNVEGNRVMAMSYYPKEGNPLWERYSTHAIIHTLNVYSRYSFTYPYPIAISVNGPIGGMEYPMICFNGPRPEPDGTYTAGTKYGLISVVIHEVGHNYFPMIVNSDERQWTWMDEGLNSFLQYLSEQEWEENYPSWRGEPQNIVEYMLSSAQVPIMTNSESALQFGNNAYGKPATALNILRETVLGRELFDFSFREYSRRWKFKRPMPADFFRMMEDASGVDLDWFWRGWFYTTDHTDIALERVRLFTPDTLNPETDKAARQRERAERPSTLSQQRNKPLPKRVDQFPSLRDFYNTYDQLIVTPQEREAYQLFVATLTERERELLQTGLNFYFVDLKNVGGLVMPVILELEYIDGTREEIRIPAEIWRYNNTEVSKMIMTKKEVRSITLDPHLETADTDLANNNFPRRPVKSRFQLFKEQQELPNPMQQLERKPAPSPLTPAATPTPSPTPRS